jgi:hypothetical protein
MGPPVVTFALSSLIPQRGLDIFSVLFIETLAFAVSVVMLRPRPLSAVLLAGLYFPVMFVVIFLIGIRAGYYDFP